jgi:sugar phosphate isomerase/epimerase
MKLGYNTWSMPTLSFNEAVKHCGRLGFDSVEVTVSEGWPTDVMTIAPDTAAEWKRAADDAGVAITSLTANAPVIVDAAAWSRTRDRLLKSLELAAQLQSPGQRMPISLTASRPIVGLGAPPRRPSDQEWEDDRSILIDRFGELASIAARLGVRVALEPHVFTVVRTTGRALFVLDQIANDALGLNLDISHFAVQGVRSSEAVAALAPRAIVSEVKDQRGTVPDFEFLVPGEGDFDYAGFLREMADAGYDGSIAVEISVFRQRVAGYDPHQAARRSYEVLSRAFELAGVSRERAKGGSKS